MSTHYSVYDFLPLISILIIVLGLTLMLQLVFGLDFWLAMRHFMGFFFLIFGLMKAVNITGFVHAYREYDLLAQRSYLYAYTYPFIEIALGCAYLFNLFPIIANIFTVCLMAVSSVGVFKKLLEQKQIPCACMGIVFKIPMTWVTLAEDILMAIMALFMLFNA